MPFFDEDDVHESFADNPESLEGRLLFAVPKSESTSKMGCELELTGCRGQATPGGPQFARGCGHPVQTRITT
jgi:hypothetical protein